MIDMAWKDIIDDSKVQNFRKVQSQKRIKRCYITELSTWMWWFYEKLAGTAKMALKKNTTRLHFTPTQLQTIITQIEVVVNI